MLTPPASYGLGLARLPDQGSGRAWQAQCGGAEWRHVPRRACEHICIQLGLSQSGMAEHQASALSDTIAKVPYPGVHSRWESQQLTQDGLTIHCQCTSCMRRWGVLEVDAHMSSQRDVSVSETVTLLLISGEASNQSPFATSFHMM